MSTGLMEGSCGIYSCVICVRDGDGGVDTKFKNFSVVEVLYFLPFSADLAMLLVRQIF